MWLKGNEAAKQLNINKLHMSVIISRRLKRKDKHFKKQDRRVYVNSEYVSKVIKTRNAHELYYDLLEHYGSDVEMIKEMAKRTGKSYTNCYLLIKSLFASKRLTIYCDTTLELYNMHEEINNAE